MAEFASKPTQSYTLTFIHAFDQFRCLVMKIIPFLSGHYKHFEFIANETVFSISPLIYARIDRLCMNDDASNRHVVSLWVTLFQVKMAKNAYEKKMKHWWDVCYSVIGAPYTLYTWTRMYNQSSISLALALTVSTICTLNAYTHTHRPDDWI